MSRLGCAAVALGVVVVAVGGFCALLYWSIVVNQDDQSALTERLDVVVVTEPERDGPAGNTEYEFDYAYETAGQWYGDEADIKTGPWHPGNPLWVCADPADPAQHVLSTRNPCGREFIEAGSIDVATPRPAPSID